MRENVSLFCELLLYVVSIVCLTVIDNLIFDVGGVKPPALLPKKPRPGMSHCDASRIPGSESTLTGSRSYCQVSQNIYKKKYILYIHKEPRHIYI